MKKIVDLIYSRLPKKLFILGLILSLLSTGMGLIVPKVVGRLLDQQFLLHLLASPKKLIGLFFFFVCNYIVKACAKYLISWAGSTTVKEVQEAVYCNLLQSKISAVENYQSGDVASRLTNDISILLQFLTGTLPSVLLNSITVLGTIYFLFQISVSMTLVSLVVFPILFCIIIPANQYLELYYGRYQKLLGDTASQLSHKFSNMRMVKSLLGEGCEMKRMADFFEGLSVAYRKVIKISVLQSTLVNALMMFYIIGILFVAGHGVLQGTMTISLLMTFLIYLMQMIEPITELFASVSECVEFKIVVSRLEELVDLDKDKYATVSVNPIDSTISLEKVTFSYHADPVLNDLSTIIPAGSHVAIVGPSGAGKSTIFSLLMKYYQDYQGEIRIGGCDLKECSEYQIRNLMSYVPQKNTLFQGTIRENLLYGKNKLVSEERIAFVLKELGLSQVVSELEFGLDTIISENGLGLSEGQKQRFSIARALLLEHPIYLLDEVTASLDPLTERIISQAIDRLTAGKTRLTIAHRLHTVREADAILMLDKRGQLVDYGDHRQLLKRNPLYQEFVSALPKAS